MSEDSTMLAICLGVSLGLNLVSIVLLYACWKEDCRKANQLTAAYGLADRAIDELRKVTPKVVPFPMQLVRQSREIH